MGSVEPVRTALSLGIPGMVMLLLAVWVYESVQRRRGKRRGTPLSETYINEITAIFHGTKRTELDHRASMSLLRDEDTSSAPPGLRVDLDRGVVVLPPADDAT